MIHSPDDPKQCSKGLRIGLIIGFVGGMLSVIFGAVLMDDFNKINNLVEEVCDSTILANFRVQKKGMARHGLVETCVVRSSRCVRNITLHEPPTHYDFFFDSEPESLKQWVASIEARGSTFPCYVERDGVWGVTHMRPPAVEAVCIALGGLIILISAYITCRNQDLGHPVKADNKPIKSGYGALEDLERGLAPIAEEADSDQIGEPIHKKIREQQAKQWQAIVSLYSQDKTNIRLDHSKDEKDEKDDDLLDVSRLKQQEAEPTYGEVRESARTSPTEKQKRLMRQSAQQAGRITPYDEDEERKFPPFPVSDHAPVGPRSAPTAAQISGRRAALRHTQKPVSVMAGPRQDLPTDDILVARVQEQGAARAEEDVSSSPPQKTPRQPRPRDPAGPGAGGLVLPEGF